jgi:isopentenyl diphosphate isomerase/L-lactate dehydrogenase-like FMN-dependent dehydrogenase
MNTVSTKTKILGKEVDIPFGVAPVAMQKLIHSEGEVLAAR